MRRICFRLGFVRLLATGLVLALNSGAVRSAPETNRLRETLLQPEERDPYGLRIGQNDARLKAIEELTRLGSPEAVGVLQEFLTTYGANRKLKQKALVALGQIGTAASVEAIRNFETWAEKMRRHPRGFRFGAKDHAIDHFQQHNLRPLASCRDASGREWWAFRWRRFGRPTWWLTQAQGEGKWSAPVLLDLPEGTQISKDTKFGLQVERESFVLRVDGQVIPFDLKDQLVDSDSDGLTDATERLLLTDPHKADTDGDGVPDIKDSSPLTPKHKVTNDETEIRQAVFSVLFATCNSQDAIVMVEKGDFAAQEYYGYGGYLLGSPKIRGGFVNITGFTATVESPTRATATIADWEGGEAASGHEAHLKRIHGKWVVVDFKMTWIS